jgi:hypothetical protein
VDSLNPTAVGDKEFMSIFGLPAVPESLPTDSATHITRPLTQLAIATGMKNMCMKTKREADQAPHVERQAGLNVMIDGIRVLVLLAIDESMPQS